MRVIIEVTEFGRLNIEAERIDSPLKLLGLLEVAKAATLEKIQGNNSLQDLAQHLLKPRRG